MIAKPFQKAHTIQLSRRCLQNGCLLFVDRRGNFKFVQDQENFHRGVPDAFVSIYEWMILDECKSERGRFLNNGWV